MVDTAVQLFRYRILLTAGGSNLSTHLGDVFHRVLYFGYLVSGFVNLLYALGDTRLTFLAGKTDFAAVFLQLIDDVDNLRG